MNRYLAWLFALLLLVVAVGYGYATYLGYSSTARMTPAVAPPAAVADPTRVRFVAVGDIGKNTPERRKVAKAMGQVCAERGCDFALALGDNLYPSGMTAPTDPRMDQVFAEARTWPFPTYLTLGNHDYGTGLDRTTAHHQVHWASRTPGIHLPAPTYRFRAGPVALWSIDTTEIFWQGEQPQATWLKQGLSESTADYKVVFGHHTFRSQGQHGNAGAYQGLGLLPVVRGKPLERLFNSTVCGHADLLLTGHDHNLQLLRHCGVVVVVSGAGASARALVDQGNTPIAGYDQTGFVWVQLAPHTMVVALYRADGQLLTQVTLPRDRAQ